MTSECQDLRDQIVGLVEGDLDRAEAARLRAHAAGCADCTAELALEANLVAALRALPPAPEFSVPCPDLPCLDVPHHESEQTPIIPITAGGRVGSGASVAGVRARLIGIVTAVAVAAALLVVVGAQVAGNLRSEPAPGDARDLADRGRAVVIRTVIDSDAEVALPDDDLLALTAGVEAVVMRRPARRR